MRLLKIKTIAKKYNIDRFDSRDSKQIRMAVSIIASRSNSPTAVADAMDFSSDWTNSKSDKTALLTKVLVQRLTEDFELDSENQEIDKKIFNILEIIPKIDLRLVLEDCIAYVFDEIDSVSEQIKNRHSTAFSESTLKKFGLHLTRGAIIIFKFFLDGNSDSAQNESASHYLSKRNETEMSVVINTYNFGYLKRLFSLQSNYDIYLSLQDLKRSDICRSVVVQLAKNRVKHLIDSNTTTTGITLDNSVMPLTGHFRRICILLQISPIVFSHTAMKQLIEIDQMVIDFIVLILLSFTISLQAYSIRSGALLEQRQVSLCFSYFINFARISLVG
jgi:hypothetical protein